MSTYSHVDEITSGTVRELDGEDSSSRTDNIGNVGYRGTGSSTEVENLGAGLQVDGLQTTEDTSSQLGSERIPDTVLGLCGVSILALVGVLD